MCAPHPEMLEERGKFPLNLKRCHARFGSALQVVTLAVVPPQSTRHRLLLSPYNHRVAAKQAQNDGLSIS
jgi:hypothetical protein